MAILKPKLFSAEIPRLETAIYIDPAGLAVYPKPAIRHLERSTTGANKIVYHCAPLSRQRDMIVTPAFCSPQFQKTTGTWMLYLPLSRRC